MSPCHNVKRKPKPTVGLFLAGAKLAKVLLTVLSFPGGDTLLVSDNIFRGKVRTIAPTTGCTNMTILGNVGAELPNEKAPQ